MANIRIKDLSTTAAVTASDDFIAVDGATNGTRKLNAYSPTFGGNLTVNGTGTSSFASNINVNKSTAVVDIGDGTTGPNFRLVSSVTGDANAYLQIGKSSADTNANLIISRYSTGSTAINSASIYATTTLLSGNFTVSGTGTSSFASGSKLGVGTTSPGVTFVAVGAPATLNYTIGSTSLADIRSTSAAATNAGPSLTFSGYYQTSLNTSTYGAIKGVLEGAGDGNSAAGSLTFLTANGAGSLSEWVRLSYTGNLLIGTTTDSGNGKLQLATHTTSAGGIGFGTDTALYRSAANTLGLSGGLAIIAGSNTTGFNQDATLSNYSSTNGVYLNGNASGWLRLSGSGGGGATIQLIGGTGSGATINFTTNNSTTALTLDGSQRCILSGALRLNNAYTASAVVPTGYVTIQDSTGTTYKVCVLL